MSNPAVVANLKHGHKEIKTVGPSKDSIRPHIAYLDFLKKHGLLEQAISATLPIEVERAAKLAVASELVRKHGAGNVRVFKNPNGDISISVSAEGKDKEEAEVNDYISHYKMGKFIEAIAFRDQFREIAKGSKYEVKSGFFMNRCVLVKGLDREIYGVAWHENYANQLCEKHVYRVQRDNLPMRGRTFVCKLLDEKRDILIHESEIGIHII